MVSGSSDPDTIILSRTYTDQLALLKIEIGEKKMKVTIDDNQTGTKEDRIDANLASKLSITEEQALRLGEIGILLEKRFGGHRDIEWAYADVIATFHVKIGVVKICFSFRVNCIYYNRDRLLL